MTKSFPGGGDKSYILHDANSAPGVGGQGPDSNDVANVPVVEKAVV